MADPISAVITAGAGLLNGIFGGIFGADANDATNQTNLELQARQNAWNLEQWNRNNEYNTPLNQIKRLKEAGLNPNLMYGQGTTGNSSSPAQGTQPPRMLPVNYMQGLVELPDTMLKMAQARLIDAQRKKVEGTTVPNEMYAAGFQARTEKDKAAVDQLRKSADYLTNLSEFVNTQNTYYGADKSATWNMMNTQIEQGWKRLAIDSAKVAIQKYEAETHRSVSIQQRHYLSQLAGLIGSQKYAQDFKNRLSDIGENGILLKIFGDGLKSWNQATLTGNMNESFWIDKIWSMLKDVSTEGRGWIDSAVPF